MGFLFLALKNRGFDPKHIIDVGANHGFWSRTALKYFPDSYYTLIEPQDWLKKDAQDILSRGKAQWISAGAADKPGTMPFCIADRDNSCSFAYSSDAVQLAGGRAVQPHVAELSAPGRERVFPEREFRMLHTLHWSGIRESIKAS